MENSISLPPFYVGQNVVYITGVNMALNSTHIINEITPSDCGCFTVGINNIPLIKKYGLFICVVCGKYTNTDSINGWAASSFRAIKEQTFPLLTYSKVIEKELVSAN